MCLAVPGKIVELDGAEAQVDFQGNRLKVAITLTPEVRVNDWILVHAGFAIATIDEADAKETWSYLSAMDELRQAEELGEAAAADD